MVCSGLTQPESSSFGWAAEKPVKHNNIVPKSSAHTHSNATPACTHSVKITTLKSQHLAASKSWLVFCALPLCGSLFTWQGLLYLTVCQTNVLLSNAAAKLTRAMTSIFNAVAIFYSQIMTFSLFKCLDCKFPSSKSLFDIGHHHSSDFGNNSMNKTQNRDNWSQCLVSFSFIQVSGVAVGAPGPQVPPTAAPAAQPSALIVMKMSKQVNNSLLMCLHSSPSCCCTSLPPCVWLTGFKACH